MIALLDSSVWVSYFHQADAHHEKAVRIVEDLGVREATLILHDIVIAETTNVLFRIDPSDILLVKFRKYLIEFDWLVQTVFGTREFWTRTVDYVAHQARLKTLDLIVVSYAYHFQVDDFKSFDTQQEKAAQRVLKR